MEAEAEVETEAEAEVEGISTTGSTQANRATGGTKKCSTGGNQGARRNIFQRARPKSAEGPRGNISRFRARGPPVKHFFGPHSQRAPGGTFSDLVPEVPRWNLFAATKRSEVPR